MFGRTAYPQATELVTSCGLSPLGVLGVKQKKWDGTIRVASHAEQLHEAIFNHLDGFSITMGMNVVCCQVSNTEGKQFLVKQAIA